ncbi:unnamed protein product [Ranitomeya imitator]|uniref:Neuron-derived neurotrophic factor N-terminal domain-containing protein n=1 Tax=Ranitomeya imitator TaxID=111125 RepID=A0ABN9M5J2_9NEOB|nr:unnamed protein product [Ranitomeya imitator]
MAAPYSPVMIWWFRNNMRQALKEVGYDAHIAIYYEEFSAGFYHQSQDCNNRMLLSHWYITLILLPICLNGQKLPTRDEELFQMQIKDKTMFHDSSVVPDGAEINGYLFRDNPKRPLLMHPMILFALAAAAWHWLLQDIVPVYQIKGISKLVKLCLPKVQCFCDSLTSPPSERQRCALLSSCTGCEPESRAVTSPLCFPAPRQYKRRAEKPRAQRWRTDGCRYFFVVEEDNTPLSVIVTPCDAPLEWKLTLQELPEEASGEGSGEPEPLEQQKQQIMNEEGTELFSYKGNDVEYFVSTNSPSGLYQLELISTEKDTHFKVYALQHQNLISLTQNYPMIQELM